MHFVRAVCFMGTVKWKVRVVNITIKAFLVIPQHLPVAHEVSKYSTHVGSLSGLKLPVYNISLLT